METLPRRPHGEGHTLVALLSIAHERGVEAEIAAALSCTLEAHELPDIAEYRERFTDIRQ